MAKIKYLVRTFEPTFQTQEKTVRRWIWAKGAMLCEYLDGQITPSEYTLRELLARHVKETTWGM